MSFKLSQILTKSLLKIGLSKFRLIIIFLLQDDEEEEEHPNKSKLRRAPDDEDYMHSLKRYDDGKLNVRYSY